MTTSMHHFISIARRRPVGRYQPWLLCQAHFAQLPADQQLLYVGCLRECRTTPHDCERCDPLAIWWSTEYAS